MFKYYVFVVSSTLSDYLTMMNFLAHRGVDKGFVVYDHRTYITMLGIHLHEDSEIDPTMMLPQYTWVFGDVGIDNEDLDQPFQLDEGLFFLMLSCDLCQTKNLATERCAIAKRLGITLDDHRVKVSR